MKQEIEEIQEAKRKLEYAKIYSIPKEALVDDVSAADKDIGSLQEQLNFLKQREKRSVLEKLRSFLGGFS